MRNFLPKVVGYEHIRRKKGFMLKLEVINWQSGKKAFTCIAFGVKNNNN